MPAGKALLAAGGLAAQGWGRAVGIAGADRPEPRLLLAHLAGRGHHPALLIQQKQIAVAAHQLQHQPALDCLAGAGGEAELHHPFPASLLQRHQCQTAQAVLQLLRQGAAFSLAGWRLDGMQPRCFRLPAEFQPEPLLQGAKAQLQGVGISLLRLFKAARQQQRLEFRYHRPQAGEVHGLE